MTKKDFSWTKKHTKWISKYNGHICGYFDRQQRAWTSHPQNSHTLNIPCAINRKVKSTFKTRSTQTPIYFAISTFSVKWLKESSSTALKTSTAIENKYWRTIYFSMIRAHPSTSRTTTKNLTKWINQKKVGVRCTSPNEWVVQIIVWSKVCFGIEDEGL